MISTSRAATTGVLAEDRLLWEFWLNHGLEPLALAERLSALPANASGWYLAGNALYGGFEEPLFHALEASVNAGGAAASALEALRHLAQAPAGQVTVDDPEGKLLALLALWPSPGSPEAQQVREAAARVTRWPSFFRAAGRSNLLPAVAEGLRAEWMAQRVPEPFGTAIESAASGIEQRNVRLLPLVEEMTAVLTRKGIRHGLLKESALLGEIYLRPGERLVGDVDLLTAPEDLRGVEEILVKAGHRPFEGIWSKSWYRQHHHHAAPLVNSDEATKFEPHTGIWIPGGTGADLGGEILAASRPHKRFQSLRPDATFMAFHLLADLHGGAGVGKLGQAADLMRFLAAEGTQVDGARLLDLAERTRSRAFIEDSVDLAGRIFGRRLLDARSPALASIEGVVAGAGHRLRRRIERSVVCGFEPRTSALSLASVKLVHRSLMQPGGDVGRAMHFMRSVVGGKEGREGVGEIALKGRVSAGRHLLRLATFPFRAVARTLRARKGS